MVRFSIGLVAATLLLALQAAPARATTAGAGTLEARGTGSVELGGEGLFQYWLDGSGVLVIDDVRNLRVHIRGRGDVFRTRDGKLVIRRFRGTVQILGRRVATHFHRGSVALRARGHGRGLLTGKGRYDANGEVGRWSRDGTRVRW